MMTMLLRPALPLIAVLLAAGPAAAQAVPTLKAEVTVASDIVRLGDLIDNAGRHAAVAVFRSPDMGQTGSVPAWRVVEAARRAGLADVAAGPHGEIAVTRAARILPLADMEERVAHALARQLGLADAERIKVTFDRSTRPIAVEPQARGELVVKRLDHNPATGRFDAVLDVLGAAATRAAGGVRVSGIANEQVEYLVPARPINRGEVLKAGDLVVERRPRSELALPGDAVVSPAQAVGLAARRPLTPERFFRAADLMKPEIVERNGNVLIVYEATGLALTIRGKALEAGAEGDVIQVQNLQSRKTMQALVTGPNRVSVVQRSSLSAAAAAPVQQ